MGKRASVVLTFVIAVCAAIAPVVLAIHLARANALRVETGHALSYARTVLYRTETIAAVNFAAFESNSRPVPGAVIVG